MSEDTREEKDKSEKLSLLSNGFNDGVTNRPEENLTKSVNIE